jgi:hypothetical protein
MWQKNVVKGPGKEIPTRVSPWTSTTLIYWKVPIVDTASSSAAATLSAPTFEKAMGVGWQLVIFGVKLKKNTAILLEKSWFCVSIEFSKCQ